MTINFIKATQEQQAKGQKVFDQFTNVIKENDLDYEEILSLIVSVLRTCIETHIQTAIEHDVNKVKILDNQRLFIDEISLYLKKSLENTFLKND